MRGWPDAKDVPSGKWEIKVSEYFTAADILDIQLFLVMFERFIPNFSESTSLMATVLKVYQTNKKIKISEELEKDWVIQGYWPIVKQSNSQQ